MATNPWMEHVKRFRAKNPNLEYKECLKRAKKSYKATGGAKKVRKSKQKGGQLNIDGNLLAQLQTYEITMNTLNNIKTAFENNINIEDENLEKFYNDLFNDGIKIFLREKPPSSINIAKSHTELATVITNLLNKVLTQRLRKQLRNIASNKLKVTISSFAEEDIYG